MTTPPKWRWRSDNAAPIMIFRGGPCCDDVRPTRPPTLTLPQHFSPRDPVSGTQWPDGPDQAGSSNVCLSALSGSGPHPARGWSLRTCQCAFFPLPNHPLFEILLGHRTQEGGWKLIAAIFLQLCNFSAIFPPSAFFFFAWN